MPRIQHKRGTSANLTSVNPTPLAGELVWDSSENAIKIGDGATTWTSLAYVTATPRTHTHSADAITSGTVAYARLPVGSTASTVCAGDDARLSDARTPTAHASTHATGGSDALTPADIGAAPAASPTFTGVITVAATSGSAGSYLPSVTFSGDANTGFGQVSGQSDSASVFTAGHERVRVDSSGRVGIGVTPTAPLHVKSSSGETLRLESTASGNGYVQFVNTSGSMSFGMTGSASNRVLLYDRTNNQSAYDYLGGASGVHRFFTNDTHRMSVKATGAVRFVPLSADPASGEAGDVYYNSSTNKLRVYNGTSWIDLH